MFNTVFRRDVREALSSALNEKRYAYADILKILTSVDKYIESFLNTETLHPAVLGEETKLFNFVADIPNNIMQDVSFHQCSCETWSGSKYFFYIQQYRFQGTL